MVVKRRTFIAAMFLCPLIEIPESRDLVPESRDTIIVSDGVICVRTLVDNLKYEITPESISFNCVSPGDELWTLVREAKWIKFNSNRWLPFCYRQIMNYYQTGEYNIYGTFSKD